MSVECSSSNIQPGYKQTEVGVIPEDWSFDYIENLSNITTGGRNTQDRVDDGLYPFFVRSQTVERINTYSFDGEAVLTAGDGVGTGKIFHYINGKFDAHQRVYRISDFNERIKGYFFYLYFSSHFYNRIMQMTAKSSVDSVRREMIARMLIPVPPKAEQEAIAECLGDADALIESLEQLISKKRQIKQGAMQELLTGKRRLPGFGEGKGYKQTDLGVIPEDWDVVNLADVGRSLAGLTYSPSNVRDFGTLVLRSSNVQNGKLVFEDNVYVDMALPERVIVEKDDILICVRNGSRQLIGKCALIDESAAGNAFGAFMSIYRSKYSKYVFYQFQSEIIQRQINEIMGATINQITNKDMASFIIPFPHSDEEKNVIAAILSDMDSEITALEEKLAKARQIKQGMMQELLTGRIRLL